MTAMHSVVALLVALIAFQPQPVPTNVPAAPSASATPTRTPAQMQLPVIVIGTGSIGSPDVMLRRMAGFQQQIDEQRAFRQSMLAALTPAHRQMLGALIGSLAIAPEPEISNAARQINAALSPDEAQNIVRLEQAKQTAMIQHFAQMAAEADVPHVAIPSVIPPYASNGMVAGGPPPFGNDAGSIVLRTLAMTLATPQGNVVPSSPPH